MDTINPILLFDAAKRFDKTSSLPEVAEDDKADAIVKKLRRDPGLQTTLYVGSGEQIATHRPSLMNNNRATVIRLEDYDHWLFNFSEVSRILNGFMTLWPNKPAMLLSHSVCWTDRAVQLLNGREPAYPEIIKPYQEHRHGKEMVLHFEAKSARKISVRTNLIRWVRPDGREAAPLLTTAKRRMIFDSTGTIVVGRSYRESISSSTKGWQDDPSVVLRGQFPAVKNLIHGLAKDYKGELKAMLPPPLDGAGHVQQQPLLVTGDKLIDQRGVMDVFLLKAWRLFKRQTMLGRERVMVDEMVFAFTSAGRIAYIAVACQPFEGWPSDTQWDQHLRKWVVQNTPRGRRV